MNFIKLVNFQEINSSGINYTSSCKNLRFELLMKPHQTKVLIARLPTPGINSS